MKQAQFHSMQERLMRLTDYSDVAVQNTDKILKHILKTNILIAELLLHIIAKKEGNIP